MWEGPAYSGQPHASAVDPGLYKKVVKQETEDK